MNSNSLMSTLERALPPKHFEVLNERLRRADDRDERIIAVEPKVYAGIVDVVMDYTIYWSGSNNWKAGRQDWVLIVYSPKGNRIQVDMVQEPQ